MNPRGQGSVQTVVEAEGLVKTFSDFWLRAKARAVDGVTFEIRPNEIFGLLGPNGSGKSTTIKMILGLLRKSKGRLSVFGRDPSDVSVKARLGYLPEETYMYRFLNPRETLDYFGKLFGLPRTTRRRRTDELLEMVGLEGAAHRVVGEFSKGMARRLGIAQALINDPEFLILDEPTSGLDPIGTRQVKDLLLDLKRRGKTILLSSHLLGDVEDVCDRMVILYGGRIRAEGTSEELLRDTAHTMIKTGRLHEGTLKEIEKILGAREGFGIDRVENPRQRLEDLFLQIVERARQEQIATSGAGAGGPTARFLLGEETEGTGLVEELVRGRDEPKVPVVAAPVEKPPATAAPATREVLDELLAPKPPAAPSAPAARAPARPKGVDEDVIRGLVDEGEGGRGGHGS